MFPTLSGSLYAKLGPEAFLVMALLCAPAVPFTWRLRGIRTRPDV